jgi:D-xylose transport system permease protein
MSEPRFGIKLNLRVASMILILILMWIFFRLQVGEFYFSGESIAKLSRDMASWTILAAGMTLVIIAGYIDLSVGSLLALVAASAALMMNPEYGPGLPANVAIPIALAIGTLLGALQGTLVAYFAIPSFIVTLGGMFVFRGITQKVSEFDPRIPGGNWVVSLGFDYVPAGTGYAIAVLITLLIAALLVVGRRNRKRMNLPALNIPAVGGIILFVAALLVGIVYKMNDYKGIPNQTLVMVAVLVVLHVISKQTTFGRYLFAIGGNVEAARVSGIKVERKTVAVFALMGFLAAVAGIVWMAQNQGSTKNGGQYYELYAIAAAIIGGTSLLGGRGSIFGTFLGGLVMATVIQGMDYTNLENWLQLVVRGSVLVLAVGLDVIAKNPPPWARRLRSKLWKHIKPGAAAQEETPGAFR